MTSSKKKRGKQRRAAKAATANNIGGSDAPTTVVEDRVGGFVGEKPDELVVNTIVTELLAEIPPGSYERWFTSVGISFESSGILSAIFQFLKRSEDVIFGVLMASEGGDLATPSTWIKLIVRASKLEPSCRLQIAQNIGPLVRCMCADTKRVFFKSNKHWRESIVHFVELIWYICNSTINSQESNVTKVNIVGTLLKHEGLLRSIVQWGFWGEEHRPDISKKLEDGKCTQIVEWGREITSWIIQYIDEKEYQKIFGIDPLDTIATTPIVSKDYDSDCMVSYMAELIRLAKAANGDKDYLTLSSSLYLTQVEALALGTDCVDKDFITGIIDFGTYFATNYTCASLTANIIAAILVERHKFGCYAPSDTRVAFAISAGLIEMCLNFIERGGHEHFERDDKNSQYQRNVHDIFTIVYNVSLHQKTAKAIRRKRNKIWKELARMEQSTNNTNCKELLGVVRSILDLTGAYCCRCNKSLGRKDINRCNGCNRLTYCSIACQKEDWLNGHNVTCNNLFAVEQSGQFQGRFRPRTLPESERAAAKLEALEINITMIQLKLFLDNAEIILNQARDLGIPLQDCFVQFNFRNCPPSVEVECFTEEFTSPISVQSFEESRSTENITCVYISNIYNGEFDEDRVVPVLEMKRLFPHEWLSNKAKKN